MKKIIYLVFFNCLLGCQSNTPVNKPTQVQEKDTIIENLSSPIPISNTDTSATKADAANKQKQTTTQIEITTTPKRKVAKKTAPSKIEANGDDLIIQEATYMPCNNSHSIVYKLRIQYKYLKTTLICIYYNGEKYFIGKTDYEKAINLPENNERIVYVSIPNLPKETTGTISITTKSPPVTPHVGKMLIEYEIKGRIKYQSMPTTIFKQDQSESRGC